MRSILLVEDAPDYARLVQEILKSKYKVTLASTLASARALLTHEFFDLVLLDVMLPDGTGFNFYNEIQTLKADNQPLIIFLTSKAEVEDRVTGWSLGADDYITKPFSAVEFMARVQSRLDKQESQKQSGKIVRWKEITLDLGFHEATIEDSGQPRQLDLTRIEFKLLYCLIKSADRVLSREQLREAAWGNTHVIERTIDKHVSSVRLKLKSSKIQIKSVSGVGYKLTHG